MSLTLFPMSPKKTETRHCPASNQTKASVTLTLIAHHLQEEGYFRHPHIMSPQKRTMCGEVFLPCTHIGARYSSALHRPRTKRGVVGTFRVKRYCGILITHLGSVSKPSTGCVSRLKPNIIVWRCIGQGHTQDISSSHINSRFIS